MKQTLAISFLLAALLLRGQTATIEILGSTSTQAVIHVSAPSSAACIYRISEGAAFSTPVHDVDAVLFPGSNLDTRPGAIINGKDHYFVAGTRVASKAADGKFYSRALQADTQHWVGVRCAAGAEQSATFRTQNPPLGNSYPELPSFDLAAFGNRAIPTIDFWDGTKTYIDPLTGILLKRISGPSDYIQPSPQGVAFAYEREVTKSGVFLAWPSLESSNSFDTTGTINDIRLHVNCAAKSVRMKACMSLDSGQSCNTDAVDLVCPASNGAVAAPTNYPRPMFAGWGAQKEPLTKVAISNGPSPAVRVSGDHVYWVAGAVPFYTERAPGSKMLVNGTAPACPNNVCTVRSVDNLHEITIQEHVNRDVGGTVLTSGAAAGDSSINVRDTGDLLSGKRLKIDPGTVNEETLHTRVELVASSGVIALQAPLQKAHDSGAVVHWAGLDDAGQDGPLPPSHLGLPANAGTRFITIGDSVNGLVPNQTIVLDLNNPTQETARVAPYYQMGSKTIGLETPLKFAHAAQTWVGWTTAVKMHDYGAGILVWREDQGGSPSAIASFTFDSHYSLQFFGRENAEFDICSPLPITDIRTDGAGKPLPAPLSGHLCSLSGQDLILWIPETGEARLLSTFWMPNVGRMLIPPGSWSATDPKSFLATNVGNHHLYKATLMNPPGVYQTYQPGPNLPPAVDHLRWTDITLASAPVDEQLREFGGPAAKALATGLFAGPAFVGTAGGYTIYDATAAPDGPCIKVRTLVSSNRIVQAFTSWSQAPLRWGGCHSGPVGIGPLLNLTVVPLSQFHNDRNLTGPFVLHILDMKRAGRWAKYEQAVTTATNSNPARFTSPAHGLDPYFSKNFGTGFAKGPVLNISGGTGAWAAVNGRWTATVTLDAPNTFTIPVDTTMFGPMTGKITWAAAPPLIHSAVRKVASGSPAVVTTSVGISSEPDAHRFRDGDPITFSTLNNQYYAKVSGYPANQFAVYSDPNLTQPVDGSAIAAARRNASRLETYFAEKCPTDVPASVTSLMFGDTGAAGVRCFTVRVEGEPCSSFATPAEHASFPCKADLSNPHKSSLQDMEVGDAVRDLSRNVYDETFVLVKKIKYSETNIEATFTRFYGNKIGADSHLSNQSANSHDVGWTPVMVPSNSHGAATGWMDATDRTTTFIPADPAFSGSHNDFGPGNAPGLVTYAGGSPDHINNKTMRDLLATPLTYTKKEYLPWAQAKASQLGDEFLQSYPGHRQSGAPPNAHRWKGDWHALNGDYGDAPTTGSGLIRGQSLKKVNGTKWVYQITNAASVFDRKRTPIYAWSGRYIFRDKSGPHSLIADTDAWTYCIADSAGECRPGSAKNDAFISQPIPPVDTQGWCLSNTINVFAPCLTGINPQAGWAMQKEIDPIDTTAHRTRRLTMGLSAPGMQWTFTTWLQTPGGKWGFFSAPYVNGLRNDYFAMKLPPWLTALEKVDRSTFVPVQRTLAALPGAKYVRARFGYAENGPVWSFFCTSRQETCVTGGDPFCFLSEWSQPLRCDSRCTLSIPAIPGRVLYFVVDRLDSTGRTVSTSPMEAVAIP